MALLKKGTKEKKPKKVKAPKTPKVSAKGLPNEQQKGKKDKKDKQGKKKMSKKALIVTIAVTLIVIIAVVAVVIFFPKKPNGTDKNGSGSTSQGDSSSDKVSSDSESTDSEKSDEESSSQLVDENGVPLIPDPDFNLMSVEKAKAVIEGQFDTTKYTVNLDEEKIIIGGKNYMSFTLSENGEQVGPPIAVNRETGEYMCFYPEKVFGDMMDYPILPLEAMNYAWNCTFERKDDKGNITCIIKTKQLEENEMRFVI